MQDRIQHVLQKHFLLTVPSFVYSKPKIKTDAGTYEESVLCLFL